DGAGGGDRRRPRRGPRAAAGRRGARLVPRSERHGVRSEPAPLAAADVRGAGVGRRPAGLGRVGRARAGGLRTLPGRDRGADVEAASLDPRAPASL
ncbi:MAG: hypothetical protein AVDCRST_MAG16-288, partial [uncultured Frankineae bacterium]